MTYHLDNYKFDIVCSDDNITITCQDNLENYICSVSQEKIKMTEKKFIMFFENCVTSKPNYYFKIKKENSKMFVSLIAQLEGFFELEKHLIFIKTKFNDELTQIKQYYENKISELKTFYENKMKENELDKSKLYKLYKEQEKNVIISKIKNHLKSFNSIYIEYCNTLFNKVNNECYQVNTSEFTMKLNSSNIRVRLTYNVLEKYKYSIPISFIQKYLNDIPIITIQKRSDTKDIYGNILTPYIEKYIFPFVIYDGDLDLTHYTQDLQTNKHIFDLYYCNFLDEFEYLQYIYKLLSNFYQLYKTQIK